jgi:hypothetical protein
MSQYVVPPPIIFQPVRRNPEKARRMWRMFAPLAIGAVVFPFLWIPTLAVPPDPAHPLKNLDRISASLAGQYGFVASLKVSHDICEQPDRYADVYLAAAKTEAHGTAVLDYLVVSDGETTGTQRLPGPLIQSLSRWSSDPDWRLRRMVARLLRQRDYDWWSGSAAEEPVVYPDRLAILWLSDPSPEVREEGVEQVTALQRVPDGLRELAMSKDPEIKATAVRALARSGTQEPQDLAMFRRLRDHPDARIAKAAAFALGDGP